MSHAPGHTVLIDGYNFLYHLRPPIHAPGPQAARRLAEILQRVRWPEPVGRIVAILDSSRGGAAQSWPGLEVCFARSADAELQRRIREAAHPERLVIITDDQDIVRTARAHGAVRHTCRWLADRTTAPAPEAARRARRGPAEEPEDRPVSVAERRRITEELAARWLRR